MASSSEADTAWHKQMLELAEARSRSPPTKTPSEILSECVFHWIQSNIINTLSPQDAARIEKKHIEFGSRRRLTFTVDDMFCVQFEYREITAQIVTDYKRLVGDVRATLETIKSMTPLVAPDPQLASIKTAFETPFVGDAHTKFRDFILDHTQKTVRQCAVHVPAHFPSAEFGF